MQACAYVGPVPVPLDDYMMSVEAQTIRAEAARREQLTPRSPASASSPSCSTLLGPAVNSGAGLFLYGAAGQRQDDDRQADHPLLRPAHLDSAHAHRGRPVHQAVRRGVPRSRSRIAEESLLKTAHVDTRWVKIRRPTVVVGGELTMDNLEIRHDPASRTSAKRRCS